VGTTAGLPQNVGNQGADDGDGAGDGVEEGTGEGASSDASGGDVVDEADGMNAPQR